MHGDEETGQTEQGWADKTPSCQLPGLTGQVGLGPLLYLLSEHFLGTTWPCAKHWEHGQPDRPACVLWRQTSTCQQVQMALSALSYECKWAAGSDFRGKTSLST